MWYIWPNNQELPMWYIWPNNQELPMWYAVMTR